ncbi:CBS domain-containing protein [Nakamurella flava]|nr:CBS domain-containing protein [Nakamurella flava]
MTTSCHPLAGPAVATRTVGQAMLRSPKRCGPWTTVAQARQLFAGGHVHALLVVDGDRLLSVVERGDLTDLDPSAGPLPVRGFGSTTGRVVDPALPLDEARVLLGSHRRRLAVVDGGRLVGLLCLKRSRTGFCTDDDVRARAIERSTTAR